MRRTSSYVLKIVVAYVSSKTCNVTDISGINCSFHDIMPTREGANKPPDKQNSIKGETQRPEESHTNTSDRTERMYKEIIL